MSNKAIFLDRDETLIEDPGYISDPEQVKLLAGAARALIELRGMGYKLVVVTNQSGVARGIVSEKRLREVHERIEQLLAENDAFLDGIYYCPYHPEGAIAKYRQESDCRKPNPGMLLNAADEMDIDLGQSWMIGNSGRDVEAGLRAGCKTILLEPASRQRESIHGDPTAHYKAVNITEAVNIIKKCHRNRDSTRPTTQPIQEEQPETVLEADEPGLEEPQRGQQSDELTSQEIEPPCEGQEDEPETETQGQSIDTDTPEQLLRRILDQLKTMHRSGMFEEFSTMRFMAGVVQMVVLLCLLLGVWLLMSPNRQDTSVLVALGFAAVFQLMSLTFFVMQSRK